MRRSDFTLTFAGRAILVPFRVVPVRSESTKKPPVAWGVRGLTLESAGTFEKTFELSTSHRVLKFPHRLGFDLADTLASDLEDSAHFFERIGVAVTRVRSGV